MLLSKDLLSAGIKPGETFGKLLKCNSLEEALSIWNKEQEEKSANKVTNPVKLRIGSVWFWLCNSDIFSNFPSKEGKNQYASNSEKLRWLQNGSVEINGEKAEWDDLIFHYHQIKSLVLFSGSKSQVTMI